MSPIDLVRFANNSAVAYLIYSRLGFKRKIYYHLVYCFRGVLAQLVEQWTLNP